MGDTVKLDTRRPLLDALGSLRDVPAAVAPAEEEAARRTRIAAHVLRTVENEERRGTRARRRQITWSWLVAALSLGSALMLAFNPLGTMTTSPVLLNTPGIAAPVLASSLPAVRSLAASGTVAHSTFGAPTPDVGFELLAGNLTAGPPTGEGSGATWTAIEPSLLRLAGNAEVELAPDTRVRLPPGGLDPLDGALEVLRGRVLVRGSGDSRAQVRIRTESVLIASRDARFSVSYLVGGTQVSVDQGSVQVDPGMGVQTVRAGETWHERTQTGARASEGSASEPAPSVASSTSVNPPIAELENAELAEQNRLFRSAMLAKRRGLDTLALERLDELLERHPRSVLGEGARVERLRILLRTGGRERARAAARGYLAAHPNGFAKQEAERVLDTDE